MRGMTLALVVLLAAGPAAAQETTDGEERPEAVPPLPGTGEAAPPEEGSPPPAEQTPPVQEEVIPRPEGAPGAGEPLDEGQGGQPRFERDVTPQSTQKEREAGQDGVQEHRGPATGETRPGETPETEVPAPAPDEEINPHEPMVPPDPDEIPDRRFETFETQADQPAGTPGLQVPNRPSQVGGTPPF